MTDDFTHVFKPGTSGTTLLVLHGTGGDEHDLLPLARMLLPEASVLSPRGQVLERGMPRFFRRLAEGVFDEADLRQRAGDLSRFVASAASRYGFDPQGVVAVGFSNGANIASATMLLHPETLAAAVVIRAMVPLVPDPLPPLAGKHVLVSNGRADPTVPPAETERLVQLLRSAGADVTLAWQPGGHQLTEADVATARAWLERVTIK
ncbi:MAG TPA: alpha/beta hydrolase [Vicinamibacterales bacterium]|jgi:predicted esterase|nr:alpha/beta hydrolase [Vicinamibacterales bacterium]